MCEGPQAVCSLKLFQIIIVELVMNYQILLRFLFSIRYFIYQKFVTLKFKIVLRLGKKFGEIILSDIKNSIINVKMNLKKNLEKLKIIEIL